METNLADFIRDTPAGREADAILRKCAHCGFWTATCPTYQLLGDELDGPRGRIYLMKQVLEGATPTERTQLHLDRCLTCRSCETTCPSGVQYQGVWWTLAGPWSMQQVGRSAGEKVKRWMLRAVIPHRSRFSALLKLGKFRDRFCRVASNGKYRQKVHKVAGRCRPISARCSCSKAACSRPCHRIRTRSGASVLDKLGISLVRAQQAGCCGAVSYHLNEQDEGLDYMRRNIRRVVALCRARR